MINIANLDIALVMMHQVVSPAASQLRDCGFE